MLKLKVQYFGRLMWKTDSLENNLMLRKTEGGRRRGQQRMRWLDGITYSMTWVYVNSWFELSWWWTGKPTQTHVYGVGEAIQPSHPLLSPSPPAFSLSQHQGLFQWVNPLHEMAKVLEFQLQYHSLQRNPRADLLQNGLVGSPCSLRDSQESSPTPRFRSINSLVLSFLYRPNLTSIHNYWKNHSLD